ncbi:ribonuclease H-like domain-containing protein [Petrimonas sulfuriphila]|uniref:3'-5' exonuclease n=1 Tax=Petrimonas sulfuriphila TaxID=285070 RepID=UPI003EC111AD
MRNKRYNVSVEEMEFIAELRGRNINDYIKENDRKGYRVRLNPKESKLLFKYREQNGHIHELMASHEKQPRILIFDIETAPQRAYVWGRWKQNIASSQVISDWYCLSWSAKWLGNSNIMSDVLMPDEAVFEKDGRIVKSLWNLFDQADIVIAHNAERFDVPKMNTRYILNGLIPPTPYRVIDTLKVARKEFEFSSNRLDDLAGYFGIDHKNATSFELWDKCVRGDQEALDYMEEYNIKDVDILEQIYIKLRPWIKGHPNLSLYLEHEEETCPYCGSTNLADTGTYSYTNVSKFSNVRCMDCSGIARRRTSDYPKEKRKQLVTSI